MRFPIKINRQIYRNQNRCVPGCKSNAATSILVPAFSSWGARANRSIAEGGWVGIDDLIHGLDRPAYPSMPSAAMPFTLPFVAKRLGGLNGLAKRSKPDSL